MDSRSHDGGEAKRSWAGAGRGRVGGRRPRGGGKRRADVEPVAWGRRRWDVARRKGEKEEEERGGGGEGGDSK